MARKKDTVCSGCGKLCWGIGKSRTNPNPNHLCQDCRREQRPHVVVPSDWKTPVWSTAEPASCAFCGDKFLRRHRNDSPSKYCSPICAAAAKRRGEYRLCAGDCGILIWCKPEKLEKQDHFFCAACWEEVTKNWHRTRVGARRRSRPSGFKERAKHYGVAYEPINFRLVYELDKWICQLCGQPVDPELKSPEPMRASPDHRIPMAHGGPHLYSNVQCSHWKCNVTKGDRPWRYLENPLTRQK